MMERAVISLTDDGTPVELNAKLLAMCEELQLRIVCAPSFTHASCSEQGAQKREIPSAMRVSTWRPRD
jgi:hypothetical protein